MAATRHEARSAEKANRAMARIPDVSSTLDGFPGVRFCGYKRSHDEGSEGLNLTFRHRTDEALPQRTSARILVHYSARPPAHAPLLDEVNVAKDIMERLWAWSTAERWERVVRRCSGMPCSDGSDGHIHLAVFLRRPFVVSVALMSAQHALLLFVDEYDTPSPVDGTNKYYGARTHDLLKSLGKVITFRPL